MNNKEFKKKLLSEFIYRYGKKYNLELDVGFFNFTVPYFGYHYDDSITDEIKKNAVKEGIINDPKKLIAVMTDFAIGDKGIYFTDEEIIVHTSRNKPKDFRLKYYDINRMMYYPKTDTLSIFDRNGSYYDININSFDKEGIKIILKVACGFIEFLGNEPQKTSDIKLNALKGYSVMDIMNGSASFGKEGFLGKWRTSPYNKRFDLLFEYLYGSTHGMVDRCLNIIERDRYYIDYLPLNNRIKEILVRRTGMFYLHSMDSFIKPKIDLRKYADGFIFREVNCKLEEPSSFTVSKEAFIEYGYITIALKIIPNFVELLLHMAVVLDCKTSDAEKAINIQKDIINDLESKETENRILKKECLEYEKKLREIASKVGVSDKHMGSAGAISMSAQGLSLGKSLSAGLSMTLKAGTATAYAFLPISAYFAYSALSSRKKKYILTGKDEAISYFDQIFDKLQTDFREFENKIDRKIRDSKSAEYIALEAYNMLVSENIGLKLHLMKLKEAIKVMCDD